MAKQRGKGAYLPRQTILDALAAHDGNQTATAQALEISLASVQGAVKTARSKGEPVPARRTTRGAIKRHLDHNPTASVQEISAATGASAQHVRAERAKTRATLTQAYAPPRVQPGDWLDDELLGRVEVGGYTNAPLPWPYRRRAGRRQLILTETLARAVRTEAARDLIEALGVSETVVWAWRRALGVDRQNNPGTQRLYREQVGGKLTPERAAKGRAKALEPEARERARGSIAAGMSERARHPHTVTWTPEMDAVLGTMPDEQAAQALGVSKTLVAVRRRHLGKPSYKDKRNIEWTPKMDERLGTAFDGDLAREWGISRSAVTLRRMTLGVPAHGK